MFQRKEVQSMLRMVRYCLAFFVVLILSAQVVNAGTYWIYKWDPVRGDWDYRYTNNNPESMTVQDYTGTETGKVNYNAGGVNPIHGPITQAKKSELYLYTSRPTSELSLGIMHGLYDPSKSGAPYYSVRLNISTENTLNDSVLLSDDGGELQQTAPPSYSSYYGNWTSSVYRKDGGVIGPISTATPNLDWKEWKIYITPNFNPTPVPDPYIISWDIYSSTGQIINLGNSAEGYLPIMIASNQVPIGSSALLLITGILGIVTIKRRTV